MIKVTAEIPATVWKVLVSVGQDVAAGDELFLLESMKMEIPVESPCAGVVTVLHVAEEDSLQEGQLLAEVEPSA
jgi:acetyl-CoA carboxylase biotin carboxyl carrier protein